MFFHTIIGYFYRGQPLDDEFHISWSDKAMIFMLVPQNSAYLQAVAPSFFLVCQAQI